MKLVRLIKMCLNETYTEARGGKYLSNIFPTQNYLKGGDALTSLLFNFALEYAIRMVHGNHVGLKLNGAQQLRIQADDINLFGDNINTINRNRKVTLQASKKCELKANTD
jgi:hypothetical protein